MQSSQLKYSFYISPFSLQSVKNLIPMRFTHIDFHTYPKQQELIRITFPTLELVNRHRCPKFHLEIRGRGGGDCLRRIFLPNYVAKTALL